MTDQIKKPLHFITLLLLIMIQSCSLPPTEDEINAIEATQPMLLKQQQSEILTSQKGVTELYFLGISADYQQPEMFREVIDSQEFFDDTFHTKGRSTLLINHLSTTETTPIVTQNNIRKTINNMAQKMDPEEDILFISLAAHGGHGGQFYINFGPNRHQLINAKTLNHYLKKSKIKWKVVVVNACYSGSFIDDLIDPYTLVITSTDAERVSYYSKSPNFSFFGRAFFEKYLDKNKKIKQSFDETVEETQWLEPMYGITESKQSRPQFIYGEEILAKLTEVGM
ncbi:hypothetical protein CW745_00295 [Psychromonas sp. psych-6C06]|uniref:C13 family peptidase n=1 Tax=Psychromonas sp. psych-6C06 TaxID=2058089 RepID=UPI000C33D7D0|nr:C13 family peptidase [Psychromonas sp. psych-6C06]PKF63331.1 hypothetical protein CW745_00295 [Psychromonas sp. psych-6C06]